MADLNWRGAATWTGLFRYCDTCTQLMSVDGLRQTQESDGFPFGTLSEFKQRSASCQFCDFLRQHVDCHYGKPLRFIIKSGADETRGKNANKHRYYLDTSVGKWGINPFDSLNLYEIPEWGARDHVASVFAVASSADPAACFVSRRPPDRDFRSDRAFSVSKLWIQECLSECRAEHQECPGPEMPDLPKRVIDVGQGTARSGGFIRVYEPPPGEKGLYVCLSYCWGGPQAVVLTKETSQKLKQGMTLSVFGKTIQDAVECTRRYGYRYLWVDALCIVQDDDKDRAAEIAGMGAIYQHAIVTIAVGMARSASEGFLEPLHQETMEHVENYPFCITLPDGTTGCVRLYPKKAGIVNTREDDEKKRIPLENRAWTLQEILLSPRVLLFGRHELLWLCHSQGYRQAERRYITYTQSIKNDFLRPKSFREEQWDFRGDPDGRWMNIVEEYTRRKLSDPEDRLNAIGGVAAAFAEQMAAVGGVNYCFGLWETHKVVYQLAWRSSTATLKTSTKSRRAPTWSWASVDDPVTFPTWFLATARGEYSGFNLSPIILGQIGNSGAINLRAKIHPVNEEEAGTLEIWRDTTEGPPTDPTGYYYMLLAEEEHEVALPDEQVAVLLLRQKTLMLEGVRAFERVAFCMYHTSESWSEREKVPIALV